MRHTPTLIPLTLVALLACTPESRAQNPPSGQGGSITQTSPYGRANPRPVQSGSRTFGTTMGTGAAGGAGSLFGAGSRMITSGIDLRPNQPNQANQPPGQTAGANGVGVLSGSERFLRENRRPGEFVGADAKEAAQFVGAQSGASETVAPATADLPAKAALNANQVNFPAAGAAPRAQRPYDPRLVVGFEVPTQPSLQVSAAVAARLKALPGLHPANRIEVSLAAGIATVRGEVASERDRALVGQLLLFEPGISGVENALRVKPPAASPAESRPAECRPSGRDLPQKPRR